MSEEQKQEGETPATLKTRRVVYVGGSYGPEANLGGIGHCRMGEGPRDIEASIVDSLVVEDGPFRDAKPEDEAPTEPEKSPSTPPETSTPVKAETTPADGASAPGEESTATTSETSTSEQSTSQRRNRRPQA
jgi:hypothetical protein